jgi:hypothetical protein
MARKRNAAMKSDSQVLLAAALGFVGVLRQWFPGSVALSHAEMSLTMTQKEIDAMEIPAPSATGAKSDQT